MALTVFFSFIESRRKVFGIPMHINPLLFFKKKIMVKLAKMYRLLSKYNDFDDCSGSVKTPGYY